MIQRKTDRSTRTRDIKKRRRRRRNDLGLDHGLDHGLPEGKGLDHLDMTTTIAETENLEGMMIVIVVEGMRDRAQGTAGNTTHTDHIDLQGNK